MDFSVVKSTLESLLSLEGVVILILGCGYIENGVVTSVSHKNPSASQNHVYPPNLSLSVANQSSYYWATMPPPSASQNYKYWPSCLSAMFLQLLSLLATFLFAKVTLELSMSICTSICHRNRSASQNQVNLHLYLSAILPIIYHANLPILPHPHPT